MIFLIYERKWEQQRIIPELQNVVKNSMGLDIRLQRIQSCVENLFYSKSASKYGLSWIPSLLEFDLFCEIYNLKFSTSGFSLKMCIHLNRHFFWTTWHTTKVWVLQNFTTGYDNEENSINHRTSFVQICPLSQCEISFMIQSVFSQCTY